MSLSKEQSVILMQKFARDEVFRRQFETDPTAALLSAGVSKQQIEALDAKCRVPACALAPAEKFEALLADVEGEAFLAASSFAVAKMKV